MIVSHRYRFIFFAVPRTGSHSVRAALEPLLGPEDWQQEALQRGVVSPVPGLARIRHGHVGLRAAAAHLPEDVWRNYFKFAVVREPFDRFVSACAMFNRRNSSYAGSEVAFMRKALVADSLRQHFLMRPQAEMLVDEQGRLGMDFVGRYENLAGAWSEICASIGIAEIPLPHSAATRHGTFDSYGDDDLKAQVAHFYRRDFELFGYPPCA